METEKTQTAKTILGKENRHGGIKLPDVCPHYKDISSKQCGINTKTHIDQGSRIEVPDTNSHTYCQLICDK